MLNKPGQVAPDPRVRRPLAPELFDPVTGSMVPVAPGVAPPPLLAGGTSPDGGITVPRRSVEAVTVPPPPELLAPPVRDLAGEGSRGTQAALMGLAFGVGMGRGTAPALGAAAARGTSLGGDQLFQNQTRIVDAANKKKVADWEIAQDKFKMAETDANRAGDELQRSDLLAQKKAQDRAHYMASLDGLDPESLQAKLERDWQAGVHQGLGIDGLRDRDGHWDVQAVTTVKQKAQADIEASRLADDEKAVLDVLRRTAPDGRQGALNALAPGLAARGSNFVQDEAGNWSVPGVDLASLDAAATGAWSPEALAARETADRNKAARAASLKGVSMLERFADDGRLDPMVAQEIAGRTSAIAEALASGEVPAKELFLLPEGALASMTPYQKELLADAQERLGLAREAANLRKRAQSETERRNKASEADRDADRELRKIRPSANFQGAQSEYSLLRTHRQKLLDGVFGGDDQARREAINRVNRRIGELESRYPALSHGWGSRDSAQDAPEAAASRRTEEFRREFMKAQKEGNQTRVEQLRKMFRAEFPSDPIPDGSVPGAPRTIQGPNGKTYNVKKVK